MQMMPRNRTGKRLRKPKGLLASREGCPGRRTCRTPHHMDFDQPCVGDACVTASCGKPGTVPFLLSSV
eukprot:556625-Pelagomonas_calceolata.AAC.2